MQSTSGPIRITIDVNPELLGGGSIPVDVRAVAAPSAQTPGAPDAAFEPPSADVAECACPDACERDHDND
jgi:hypothetical protein